MNYLSVCSGIEAATQAWSTLGWHASAVAEIEAFPRAVLAYRQPEVPNLGDITNFQHWPDYAISLLVGGTPCQSFSVAGLRQGLRDPRGNLMLTFGAIAARYRPRWLVLENVPGVLSSNGGRDFGSFLGLLGELGYGFAYRVLDAQYFGLAQRRKRVFVVGCLGDWRRAAAVLFERQSLRWDSPPRRKAGKDLAPTIRAGAANGGAGHGGARSGDSKDDLIIGIESAGDSRALNAKGGIGRIDAESETFVVGALCSNGKAAGSATQQDAESGMLVAAPLTGNAYAVRRLTPRECERLQGFPDDYTLIPFRGKSAADGPRYKALGNSMAVPVMRWIGNRIELVEGIGSAT